MDLLTEILRIFVKAIIENVGQITAYLVSISLAFISTYYTVKYFFFTKQETEKKAKIKISPYYRKVEDKVYFVIPFKSCRKFLIPLTLQIENEGGLSAKDVEVYMEMNDSFYKRDVERKLSNIAKAKHVAIAAEEGSSEDMTTSYMKVGNIPPSQSARVTYEIFADRTTVLDIPVGITTKDDVKAKINVEAIVSIILNIIVTYENANPVCKELQIQFRKGSAKRLDQFFSEELKLIQKSSSIKKDAFIPRHFIFFEKYEYVRNTLGEAPYRIYRAKQNSIKFLEGNLGMILESDTINDDIA